MRAAICRAQRNAPAAPRGSRTPAAPGGGAFRRARRTPRAPGPPRPDRLVHGLVARQLGQRLALPGLIGLDRPGGARAHQRGARAVLGDRHEEPRGLRRAQLPHHLHHAGGVVGEEHRGLGQDLGDRQEAQPPGEEGADHPILLRQRTSSRSPARAATPPSTRVRPARAIRSSGPRCGRTTNKRRPSSRPISATYSRPQR